MKAGFPWRTRAGANGSKGDRARHPPPFHTTVKPVEAQTTDPKPRRSKPARLHVSPLSLVDNACSIGELALLHRPRIGLFAFAARSGIHYNETGAPLRFHVGLADIFTEYACREQLNATQNKQRK